MKFIDFFSGIGGFHSGLTKAGMKCIGYCEIDKFARRSYEALYDTKDIWTAWDVRSVNGKDLPKADLWCFGFPCQDISIAGLRKGIHEGTRSGLFFEIMRLLDEREENDRPKILLIENVKHLLSVDEGWGFYSILLEMDKKGYDVEWNVYNSKAYGTAQSRERVYIVGHLRTTGTREVLPKERSCNKTIIQIGQLIETKSFGGNPQTGRVYSVYGLCPTLTTMQGGQLEPKIYWQGGIRKLTPLECWRLQGFTDEQFRKAEAINSNTQLYKQAGNAVTVNVAYEIGKEIMKCYSLTSKQMVY